MFKVTCLATHERIDRSPRIDHLEIPRTAAAPEQNHLFGISGKWLGVFLEIF
jgi:hypothetical protein